MQRDQLDHGAFHHERHCGLFVPRDRLAPGGFAAGDLSDYYIQKLFAYCDDFAPGSLCGPDFHPKSLDSPGRGKAVFYFGNAHNAAGAVAAAAIGEEKDRSWEVEKWGS